MSSSDEPTPEEIQAIAKVIQTGECGDFYDVVRVVKEKFGFQVGAGMVEEVYHALREGGAVNDDSGTPTESAQPRGEEVLEKVVRFAQEMGGFEQARAALDAVEKRIRELS